MSVADLHPRRARPGPYAYALMAGRLAANLEALLDAEEPVARDVAEKNARAALRSWERLNDPMKGRRA